MISRRVALPVIVGLCVALALVGAGCGSSDDTFDVSVTPDAPADYRYVIPAGSGVAIDAGEPLDLMPGELEVELGEVIEIVNEDDRGHLVGPFFVGAEETVRQEFSSRGEYTGICTVHSSGEIVVTVK